MKRQYKDGTTVNFENHREKMSRLNEISEQIFVTLQKKNPGLSYAEAITIIDLLRTKLNNVLI